MILEPLTDYEEIKEAQEDFELIMSRETEVFPRTLGFQGDNIPECEVHWDAQKCFWYSFDLEAHNRHWNAFGLEYVPDVSSSKSLGIVAEINFPFDGVDRRIAGVFAKSERGRLYITHSGKIGGGRKGIGKTAFRSYYKDRKPVTLAWNDKETEAILIGPLLDSKLPSLILEFVKEVDGFKRSTVGRVKQIKRRAASARYQTGPRPMVR